MTLVLSPMVVHIFPWEALIKGGGCDQQGLLPALVEEHASF